MIKFLIKTTISVLLIWWLVSKSDADRIAANLLSVDPWGMALAMLVLGSLSLAQSVRWSRIVRSIGNTLPFKDSFTIVLIGLFFNQTLPSTIGGDAVRIWRAYRLGLPPVVAAHSVMLDRLSALLALVLMAAVGAPITFSILGDSPERWGVLFLVIGGLAAFTTLFLFDRIPGKFMKWRVFRAIAGLSADARRAVLYPSNAASVILISVCIHTTSALTVFIIARSMSLPIEALSCIVLVPPVILFSMLPISIAGWGLREGAMVTAFAFVGIGYDDAFSLSVLFGLAIMATGIPGGIIWLLHGDKRTGVAAPEGLFSQQSPETLQTTKDGRIK